MVSPYQPHRFPESDINTTDAGPDFPGSSGDRERGKFRPSRWPRFDTVAVSGDEGLPITGATDRLLAELILWQRATVISLSLLAAGNQFRVDDVLSEANNI